MIDSFFIASDTNGCSVLIEKHWTAMKSSQIIQKYWPYRHQPITNLLSMTIFNVHHNDLFYILTTTRDINTVDVFHQLSILVELFLDYFGDLSDLIIKDNFTTVYQASFNFDL